MNCFEIGTSNQEISEGIKFIESVLTGYKLKKKTVIKSMLSAEELMIKFSDAAMENSKIKIEIVKSFLGQININISCAGSEIDFGGFGLDKTSIRTSSEENSEGVIRNVLLRSSFGSIVVLNINGVNTAEISVKELKNKLICIILVSVAILAVLGFVFKDSFILLFDSIKMKFSEGASIGTDFVNRSAEVKK